MATTTAALLYFLSLCLAVVCSEFPFPVTYKDLRMPGVTPEHHDHYLCTGAQLSPQDQYIVKFEPEAEMNTAHHMILFGCDDLAVTGQPSWGCEATYTICKRSMKIMFAWARNAPSREMPTDVGFRVGAHSNINYLVLQVHYAHTFADHHKDYSGLKLSMTSVPQKFIAGVWLMAAFEAYIPPHTKVTHSDISCKYSKKVPIHAFAMRVHAHALGKVISGYVYQKHSREWVKLGKGNPQWPQSFYPLEKELTISRGDIIAARCTYDSSNTDKATTIGSTANDEMCNLYIMYYTDAQYGTPYGECGDNEYSELVEHLPAGNDVPLPPNPKLDEIKSVSTPSPPSDAVVTPQKHVQTVAASGDGGQEGGMRWPAVKIGDVPHLVEDLTWQPRVTIGDVGGVSVDASGFPHIFHRAGRKWGADTFSLTNVYQHQAAGAIASDVVLKLDPVTGEVVSSWGAGLFYLPHGLHMDADGNVWLTDVALHQVFKFPPAGGKPLLTLGEKFKPGRDLNHFCKPAAVAVARSGEVFVADGYCNSRVMKFSPDGKLLQQWSIIVNRQEAAGTGNSVHSRKLDMFHIPHSITIIEPSIQNGNVVVCIADRENALILCFDSSGKFLADFGTIREAQRLFAIAYSPSHGGLLYGVTGPALDGERAALVTGLTISIINSTLVDRWAPGGPTNFSTPHTIAVSPTGDVYVGEVEVPAGSRHVRKFSTHPPTSQPILEQAKRVHTATESKSKPRLSGDADGLNLSKLPGPTQASGDGEEEKGNTKTSLVIVAILAIPVLIIVIVTACVRLRRNRSSYGGANISNWMQSYRAAPDKFNIGGLLTRHRGFDRVSTEESDHDLEQETDSDVEEYTAVPNGKITNRA